MNETNEHNQKLREKAIAAIDHKDLQVMLECAKRGYGEARAIDSIVALATEAGANVKVVVAGFGFMPSMTPWLKRWADVLDDVSAFGLIDPADDGQMGAWVLCRLAANRHGNGTIVQPQFVSKESAGYVSRLMEKLSRADGEKQRATIAREVRRTMKHCGYKL